MTPGDLLEYVRQSYNAVNDDFFPDALLYRHIWAAQMELAKKALLIERVYTTTTVADTQEYSFPTNTIAIKRVTYDGFKLEPITFREDDALTTSNAGTTASGRPAYYASWDFTLFLRPIPNDALTLKIFSYNQPQEVSATSALEVPENFHLNIADFLLWKMASQDKNMAIAEQYQAAWSATMKEARQWRRLSKRGDGFSAVQDIETLPASIIGAI